MSQPMIILYDVPSNIPQPWAPNAWRIRSTHSYLSPFRNLFIIVFRLILNYKRLPYRTCWVEFPDIEPTLRAINAPPTSTRPDGRPVYTLPAILDPTHVSSSTHFDPSGSLSQPHPVVLTHPNTIAEYLEHTYPARPVVPEGTCALQTLFVHYVSEIFVQPLLQILVPLSHQRLPPRVQNHFRAGVAGHRGDTYDTAGALHARRREEQWVAVQAQFAFLAGILEKNACDGDGDVAMGHELTYADFAICSVLIWIEKIAPHEGWPRVREWDGGRWWRLWERCKGYMDVF
ncbi:hypothetical protein J3R82DRAFT_1588 [Butyriboletus roseoflavus]|nr:hypothetical protein J3R82DRAFT_1588 [Butyriboletus roseoflavus]